MDDSQAQLIANLNKHVFGEDDPSFSLLNKGRFPPNWVARYVSLVEKVSHVWGSETCWPREIVAPIHFASFYLRGRYDAWGIRGTRDETTETELNRVRGVSEAFIMGRTTADRE